MAQSLKTKYLLTALGVGGALSLLLGGFAYYAHRIETADSNQLTYSTVEQRLEGDLEARADSVANATGALLAPAVVSGNIAGIASIARRLLQERDIERVDVTDARGAVLFSAANPPGDIPPAPQVAREPLIVTRSIPPGGAAAAPGSGTLQVWVSRQECRRRSPASERSSSTTKAIRSSGWAVCLRASRCRCSRSALIGLGSSPVSWRGRSPP